MVTEKLLTDESLRIHSRSTGSRRSTIAELCLRGLISPG
jgi:hypothetical protein